MYADFETRTSFRYLKEVIQGLNDPICILGVGHDAGEIARVLSAVCGKS